MSESLFGMLSDEDRARIAVILQGGKGQFGVSLSVLKFSRDPIQRDSEVGRFVEKVNSLFRGMFQIVRHGDKLIPLAPNTDFIQSARNALNPKTLRLAIVILLHSFYNENGPTLGNLEEKLRGTKFTPKDIQAALRELEELCMIEKKTVNGIEYNNPTPVLYACISKDTLKNIYSKAFSDDSGNEMYLRYLPKEYMEVQRKMRFRSLETFTGGGGKQETANNSNASMKESVSDVDKNPNSRRLENNTSPLVQGVNAVRDSESLQSNRNGPPSVHDKDAVRDSESLRSEGQSPQSSRIKGAGQGSESRHIGLENFGAVKGGGADNGAETQKEDET
jgi:hypothetical protein